MAALSGETPEAPAPAPAPEPVAAEAPQAAASETPAAEGNPERDEHGRFKPKTTEAQPGAEPATATAPTEPEPAKPEEEGASKEPTRIPPSLSAAVKSQWGELPPVVRDEFSRLEDSFQKGKAEWATKGQRLNRFDEILGPHLDKWRFAGLDEFSGVQTLIAAQNILERNPVEGLVHIARSYGVNPQQIAQALGLPQTAPMAGAEGQYAPTAAPNLDAALQPYLERVQTLEQRLHAEQQRAEADKLASAQAEVASFASQPEHIYFENVKADIAKRLESGAANTLAEAYEQAVWASSEIRPLLMKQQTADLSKKSAEDAARAKAQAAKQASGSVTGAPSPGAQAPKPGSSGSIRADLEAAMQAHSATA